MWPWAHLAVGYLVYTASTHARRGRSPTGLATLAVAGGTQLPDAIDKPLAWTVGVLPSGRSLAHSLLVASLVVAVAFAVARRYDRQSLATAFGAGYLSHLAADGLQSLVAGEYVYLSYLGWPVLPPPPYGVEQGFVGHVTSVTFTPYFAFQLALTAVAGVAWWRDARPGLVPLRNVAIAIAEKASPR